MQNKLVREVFPRWIRSHINNPKSAALAAANRIYADVIEPVIGSQKCCGLEREAVRSKLEDLGRRMGWASSLQAYQLVSTMMEYLMLWPRQPQAYEAFSPRTSIEIPLSAFDVADLVTRMPTAYRTPVHLILLTGIKPSQLLAISRVEFSNALGRAQPEHGEATDLQAVSLAGQPHPVYLTLPAMSSIQRHLARVPESEQRIFPFTATAIKAAWSRYAGSAPALKSYKGTAATHLIRHGADAHVLSANLGITLANAELVMELLSPSTQDRRTAWA